jgi:hypothetical protein
MAPKKKPRKGREHNVPEGPCHYCGSNAKVHRCWPGPEFSVHCEAKRCPVNPMTNWYPSREEAAAVWNGERAKRRK